MTGSDVIVVMGVSGSGKTTVAAGSSTGSGWEFAEGDDFHPAANVAKMRAGHPLDRRGPLAVAAQPRPPGSASTSGRGRSVVVTCSALKRSYRDLLRDGHPSVWFAHVDAPTPDLIRERLEQRTGHYMPPSLLRSQLATLEPLADDEPGVARLRRRTRRSGRRPSPRRARRCTAAGDLTHPEAPRRDRCSPRTDQHRQQHRSW